MKGLGNTLHYKIDLLLTVYCWLFQTGDDDDADDQQFNIFCVTCGHAYSQRVVLRHMEKCQAKVS